jgi:hypothetical protein
MRKYDFIICSFFACLFSCSKPEKLELVQESANTLGDMRLQILRQPTGATDSDPYQLCLIFEAKTKCPLKYFKQQNYSIKWIGPRTVEVHINGGQIHEFKSKVYLTGSTIDTKVNINLIYLSDN